MQNFTQSLNRFVADEWGQDLIEFALVSALVGLGAVVAMKNLATNITNAFNSIGTTLSTNV
jgi:pilus assembly protein Flp/PilA